MAKANIPVETKCRLWGKAAGRCEYRGCNAALWIDGVTQSEFNTAYIAHIIADSPDGPRGDPVLSTQLQVELANLMVVCDAHHRLIDRTDVAGHSVAMLQAMKTEHETRVERMTAAVPLRSSEVVLFGANVGEHSPLLSYNIARLAMVPDWYPASPRETSLGLKNSADTDRTPEYWSTEARQLRQAFDRYLRPRLADGALQHLSVFALAPQPLLVLLGFLIGDITPAVVYQLHREPPGWGWPNEGEEQTLRIEYPTQTHDTAALVLALSAEVDNDRVMKVLGAPISIYKVTVSEPNNDYLKTRGQLREFRECLRALMVQIRAAHGQGVLHVFPAAPVSPCVELGRILMPKSDMQLRMYDENKHLGGFVYALDVNAPAGDRS